MTNKKSYGVSLRNVVKAYDDNIVLKGIDLEIAPGSLTTLLGPSGCGKTTILRLIAGLELPTSGQLFLGDEDVSTLSASRRDVAMVFQSYALFPHMTVGENVGYGLKVQKVPASERKDRIAAALDSVGMGGFQERYIDQISGGQQQRVAVARALILEPHVMLFDEPLSNLDTKLRRQMREDIRRLQQETGITSVYVTHDQNEALSVSDAVLVMKAGEISQLGTPEELYLQPKSEFVATFMGDANIVDADLSFKNKKAFASINGYKLELISDTRGQDAGPVRLAIRPEALTMVKGESKTGICGVVTSRAYIGSGTEYVTRWKDADIFTVMPTTGDQFKLGDMVHMEISSIGVSVIMG